jgi:limonene-1,2-epoxide hydrolase
MNSPTSQRIFEWTVAAAVGGAAAYVVLGGKPRPAAADEQDPTLKTVLAFLHAQSERDLDKMCALVAEDVVYINEPHPPDRAIRGRDMFRAAFADSPCIWCPQANLQVLQYSHAPGSDTVFVERLDQFFIDGHWLRIPICGYLVVAEGKVTLWKDYWDYTKYKAFVTEKYGKDFRLFRKTLPKTEQ